ncbi:hypothetical protein JCM1841_000571 [Sporobolomyces salmonicolor]
MNQVAIQAHGKRNADGHLEISYGDLFKATEHTRASFVLQQHPCGSLSVDALEAFLTLPTVACEPVEALNGTLRSAKRQKKSGVAETLFCPPPRRRPHSPLGRPPLQLQPPCVSPSLPSLAYTPLGDDRQVSPSSASSPSARAPPRSSTFTKPPLPSPVAQVAFAAELLMMPKDRDVPVMLLDEGNAASPGGQAGTSLP